MKPVYRILDANFNRAREGLRVVEDWLRFAAEAPTEAATFKRLRHRLSAAFLSSFPAEEIWKSRDSRNDPGKEEDVRSLTPPPAIAERNLLRVSEALRCLEEYAKATNPDVSRTFHDLRFRFYEAARKTHALVRKSTGKNARPNGLTVRRKDITIPPSFASPRGCAQFRAQHAGSTQHHGRKTKNT